MDCHPTPRSTIRKIVTTLLCFAFLAGAAILYGESHLKLAGSQGVYWQEGRDWWAPNDGQCARCGGILVNTVDRVSACRYCADCNVAYRHSTLPATLEEQARVWTSSELR